MPDGTLRRYFFDLDSNRTQITENGQTTASYLYDPANPDSDGVDQLTSVTESGQTRTFVHDADGNVSRRGTDTLTWDGWGRLTGGMFSETSISYGFDAVGFRRQRVANGITTRYLQGGLFETDGAGTVTNTDVDGAASDLTHYAGPPTTGTTVTYLYYNGHGDLAAQADAAGARTDAFTYDPFGAPRQTQPANKTVERWTGRWDKKLDTASSLIEMGARPYDPELGRFLAIDPVDGGSLNAYDYAYQDPINVYDLDGRCPPCLAALGVLVRVVAAIGIRWLARKAAQKAIGAIMKKPDKYLRGDPSKTIKHLEKLADKAGWRTDLSKSSKAGRGAFRMWDGKNKSIRFNPGGTRRDAAHGFGRPYWDISSSEAGKARIYLGTSAQLP